MTQSKEKARKQGKGVSPISGVAPPVDTRFGGKNANPRHNGAWKKEDTARYKLEQMMKLGAAELQDIIDDPARPVFEQKLAKAIQDGQWREVREMIDQVYGKPVETVNTKIEEVNPYANLTLDELKKLAG